MYTCLYLSWLSGVEGKRMESDMMMIEGLHTQSRGMDGREPIPLGLRTERTIVIS